MGNLADHPHPDYCWGCPHCGGCDVQKVHNTPGVRAVEPRYKCRECGERFWVTQENRIGSERSD